MPAIIFDACQQITEAALTSPTSGTITVKDFVALSALMQLDALDEWEEKGNFFLNVEKRLERTELAAIRHKNDHRARKIIYVLMALALAAIMGVSMGV